jgi:hypothetical protein
LWVENNRGGVLKGGEKIMLCWLKLKRKRTKLTKTLVKILNKVSSMRLTVEQRLQALERDTVVLHDTMKLLHKLLKEQGELISGYIVQKMASANANDEHNAKNTRPEEELYTFVCKQRFDKIERDVKKTLKLIENLRFGLKAG